MRLVDATAQGEAATVVEFAVLHGWKGVAAGTTTLHTQRNMVSCDGYEFVVGVTYLVFATENGPTQAERYHVSPSTKTYGVSLCGGTTVLWDARGRDREQQAQRLSRRG